MRISRRSSPESPRQKDQNQPSLREEHGVNLPPRATVTQGATTRVRIDKWLWAARFFKTRSLASKACELSRVTSNGQSTKPSKNVCIGDQLLIKTPSGDFQVEVLGVSDIRGPAALAQEMYRESDESQELRRKVAEEKKAMPHFEAERQGKPSKRDRRDLDRFHSFN